MLSVLIIGLCCYTGTVAPEGNDEIKTALTSLLQSTDKSVRDHAVRIIAALANDNASAMAALEAGYGSFSDEEVIVANRFLGDLSPAPAWLRKTLKQLLHSRDNPQLAFSALLTLHQMREIREGELLELAKSHGSARVRGRALLFLADNLETLEESLALASDFLLSDERYQISVSTGALGDRFIAEDAAFFVKQVSGSTLANTDWGKVRAAISQRLLQDDLPLGIEVSIAESAFCIDFQADAAVDRLSQLVSQHDSKTLGLGYIARVAMDALQLAPKSDELEEFLVDLIRDRLTDASADDEVFQSAICTLGYHCNSESSFQLLVDLAIKAPDSEIRLISWDAAAVAKNRIANILADE